MPKITLLDGTIKNYNDPITPIEIASEISISLSKDVFFAIVNNKQWDKTRPIVDDSLLKSWKFSCSWTLLRPVLIANVLVNIVCGGNN